jgi:hypothetical protein
VDEFHANGLDVFESRKHVRQNTERRALNDGDAHAGHIALGLLELSRDVGIDRVVLLVLLSLARRELSHVHRGASLPFRPRFVLNLKELPVPGSSPQESRTAVQPELSCVTVLPIL